MEAFKREPALIIGAVVAVITSIIAGVNDGGWQWDPDGWIVLSQLATALGIRQVVFSPHSVDERIRVERLAPGDAPASSSKAADAGSRGIR
jgi:hypothetical protein